ncbi:UdgX family uracil-DNA binding protein [Rubinisphaera margarita]|uniref:UdgX family uracil-DNA binding protein n=1 Tax=Rubinisphaera margarita TaxID=2909586 RepID=UPI001EE7C8B1|nr:UdgX family uracil-DNA binding protein [Rubinisphaera margarita]MCG6157157.1 UdgX family uracil-DNA binding protein [Rubinisphaera margarita]
MPLRAVETFEEWRESARELLAAGISPEEVTWAGPSQTLFTPESAHAGQSAGTQNFSVPPEFIERARTVACHLDVSRWELLYRMLWRLTHGERHLLKDSADDDVSRFQRMHKAVTRDVHKMKAFVRFRKVEVGSEERFIAWHRPDHRIVRLAAPFFARRFPAMEWTILTPAESVSWDQQELRYGPGVPASEAPEGDVLEDLWKTYYVSTFNPARIKMKTMKKEMPVRHWPTLPETALIPEMLEQAGQRVTAMINTREGFETTATSYFPERMTWKNVAEAAQHCKACHLHEHATQTVFGAGAKKPEIVIIGEQPGDREDLEGEPFVGPAGQLLDEALAGAKIDRASVYITNVVKHFKFTHKGKRRLHQKPNAREISACRPWLEAELEILKPSSIVLLGATAAQALLGRDFRITRQRGEMMKSEWCDRTIATWHPAAILRMPDQDRRRQMKDDLTLDLAAVR